MATFDWEHFFELAQEWETSRTDKQNWAEARCRCIISRAYYGVWNLCREYAEESNRPLPAIGSAHDNIILWFERGETLTHKDIALNLQRLKSFRVTADYRRHWRGGVTPAHTAENAILYANRVLNALGDLD